MSSKGEIRSEMNNLTEVIINNDKTFHIPDFQRDFVWTSEQAIDLFHDFQEDTNGFQTETSDLQGYLLGNIVLIDDEDKWLVVDGQQRLTTLTLTFKALYEVIKEKAYNFSMPGHDIWLQRLAGLDKAFYKKDDAGNVLGLKITHEPTLPFGDYYKALIRDNKDVKPIVESDENIDEVYNTIVDKIQELDDEQLFRFNAYLRTKVKLIVTTAPSPSKAFQLFEVLNDRGRSLEPLDLIKNRFLKQLTASGYSQTDVSEFNKNWSDFITNLQISKKRVIKSSTFMRNFIIAEYGENIKQDRLFDFFHKDKNNRARVPSEEIIPLSRKLLNTSKQYQEIEKQPASNSFSEHQNMFILFRVLGVKQLHPLLMIFYGSDQEIKDRILDVAVRYGASILFSYTQTNTIEKELPQLLRNVINKNLTDVEKADVIVEELDKLIEKRRKTIETIIPTKDFSNTRGNPQKKAGDMLKFIELYFNNNTSIKSVPRGKRITVEHILSRSLNINLEEYGFISHDELQDYKNRIGNLTLLYNVENSSLGNSSFGEKINAYEKTDFIITRTIVKNVETSVKGGKTAKNVELLNEYQPNYVTRDKKIWTKEDIDRRGENIAKLVSFLVSKK